MFTHDQLFKELFRLFFREFLELFFPAVAAKIDFASVRFLEQEIFADFPGGEARRADTVVEVRTVSGDPEIVVFHVETEVWRRSSFRSRMFAYYHLLTDRLKKPVYPIAVYLSRGTGGIVTETYERELFDLAVLTFRYKAVGLPDLNADDYLTGQNLVGVALSAMMKPGPNSVDSVTRKWKAIQTILRSRVSESGKILLTNLVQTYAVLTPTEAVQYENLVAITATKEERNMISYWEQLGLQKGLQQGVEQGMQQGQRSLLLRQLTTKYGELPQSVYEKIGTMSESELLTLGDRILTASTIGELGLLA